MEELIKRLGSLKNIPAIKREAKLAGFEPKKENDKYWNYTFYNKTTDQIIGLHWKDKNNFTITMLPGKYS
jgi:hypothetical protein